MPGPPTPRLGLPTIGEDDSPDVPRDLDALANALDSVNLFGNAQVNVGQIAWGGGDTILKRTSPAVLNLAAGLHIGPAGHENIYLDGLLGIGYFVPSTSGGVNQQAVFVGLSDDPTYSRWEVLAGGKMSWGDGSLAPDTFIERSSAAVLSIHGTGPGGGLKVGANIFLDGLLGIGYFAPATSGGVDQQALFVGLSGDPTYSRWEVLAGGKVTWGDGVVAPDVTLERLSPGLMKLHSGLYVGDKTYLDGSLGIGYFTPATAGGANQQAVFVGLDGDPTYARWHVLASGQQDWGDGTNPVDVTLERAAAGVLQIPQHGGGLRLTSPDGTQTKTVTINNSGVIALV